MEVKKKEESGFWSQYGFVAILVALALIACGLIYRNNNQITQNVGDNTNTTKTNAGDLGGMLGPGGGDMPPDGAQLPSDMGGDQPPSGSEPAGI